MNRFEIENCNDIEALKQLCLAQRSQLNYIGNVLVRESKWEITAKEAIERIRNYMVKHQNDLKLPEKEELSDNNTFTLRDATPEERESVKKYIDEISRRTGVNFYEELKKIEDEAIKDYFTGEHPGMDLKEAVNVEMNTLYTDRSHYNRFYNKFADAFKNKENKEE